MNLFLADSLNISIQLLFAVLVIVSLLLLGVVLMQRPKQEGLGAAFGAAITDQAFGARTTDVLKKATVYFGTAFMVLCLGLGMLINRQHVKSSESLLSPEMMKAAARQEASVPAKTPEELQQEAPGCLCTGVIPSAAVPGTGFEIDGAGCFPLALNCNCATLGKV